MARSTLAAFAFQTGCWAVLAYISGREVIKLFMLSSAEAKQLLAF